MSGIKFSSDSGEWIFLPTAGHDEGPDLLSDGGFYWSSNVVENKQYMARAYSFKSPNLYFGKDEIWRFLGSSIRPVSD